MIRSLKAEKRALITRSQGQTMAAKIEAYTYLECSARTQLGLSEVDDYNGAITTVFPGPSSLRVG